MREENKKMLSLLLSFLTLLSGVQYEAHIQYQPDVKAKLDIAHFQRNCYESKLKGLSDETTLVLSNTRELDRVLSTEWSTLYTNLHGLC